ncbi:hypothetical protein DFJ73DRAFT_769097 [Zopfochytrium polystomum]|nr:hypothetical protein DFJ73DRAFT_769097 [Zopfochytrium polystomum]
MHFALLVASAPRRRSSPENSFFTPPLKSKQPKKKTVHSAYTFRLVGGRVLPHASELADVAVLYFLVSFAFRELSHDLPFAALSFLSSMFVFSLTSPARAAVEVPTAEAVVLGWSYIAATVLEVTGPTLAIATGIAADTSRPHLAALLVLAHYGYSSDAVVHIVVVAVSVRRLRRRASFVGESAASEAATVQALSATVLTATGPSLAIATGVATDTSRPHLVALLVQAHTNTGPPPRSFTLS